MFESTRENLLRLLYPAECGLCGIGLGPEVSGLCEGCRESVASKQLSLQEAILEHDYTHLDAVWTLYPYEGSIKELLHRLKYQRRYDVASILAREGAKLLQAICSDIWYALPLHRRDDRRAAGFGPGTLLF